MNALKSKKPNIKSIIFVVCAALLCAFVCCVIFYKNILPAVALEQEIRCDIKEHIHTDSCYDGDFQICTKPAHSHDGNCYIVLLKENDINSILSILGQNKTKTLEYVISDVVSYAFNFNENLNTAPDKTLSQTTIAQLNTTISQEEEIPDFVLNENINNVNTIKPEIDTDVSTQVQNPSFMAVGDPTVTQTYKANILVYINRSWTNVGNCNTTVTGSGNNRSTVIDTAQLLTVVNGSLGTNYTYQDFDIAASRYQGRSYTAYSLGQTQTTIGSGQSNSNASATRYIRILPKGSTYVSNTGFAFYSAKFIYPDGNEVTRYTRTNQPVVMPGGNYEWTSGNNTYASGQSVTLTGATTFTGVNIGPITNVSINYDVNFPTVSNVTISSKPTIAGLTTQTVTDGFSENKSAVIRNVSQTSVKGKVNNDNTGLSRIVQFKGWKIEGTDIILQPNTTLIWQELLNYGSDGSFTLKAVWETHPLVTATFFVRLDSVAVDTEGNTGGQDSSYYTDELFATYVGGVDVNQSLGVLDDNNIADTTSDNSFGADQKIRALYGEKSTGVWLYDFPHDDFIFEELKQYARSGYLSVEGEKVSAEDLNDIEYAIRWYVFKVQDDAWHIDGKLVRKQGLIHVYKTFAGNKELITEAKSDFYIDAIDETTNTTTVLNLQNYTTHNETTDTYMWEITDVKYGELWSITEHPHKFSNPDIEFSVYSEYTVMDSHGNQSVSGAGTSITVRGMTYALDEGTNEVLRAEFTNIYNKSNSIIIKKQDSLTGVSISGATFQLLQNGKPLKFTYNNESESYVYDAVNGTQTTLSGDKNGYFELFIEDFSYDLGNVVVREINAPTGYTRIGDIEVGYIDDKGTVGIIGGNSELIKYVNGILIVGNSTDAVSVTAKKKWDCPEIEWQNVKVQLLASGKLVTTVMAGVEPTATLTDENGWSYTWQNLPVYVNGEKIVWSIKEVQIGSETPKADGSFVNWIAAYELPVYEKDENGNEKVTLTVTNTTKRVLLRLTKTDITKSVQLKGATFLLEAVDANGNVLTDEIAKRETTSDAGTLIFDNLKCGIRYRLTEEEAPQGYHKINEYAYFVINEDGSVAVEESYYAQSTNTAYNIIVRNAPAIELPESGGGGNSMFYVIGIMLIIMSLGICIDTYRKRRCQN